MPEKRQLTVEKIRKRDGRIVPFDQNKIATAILKAMRSVGELDKEKATAMAQQVTQVLDKRFDGHTVPSVEGIQDIVEEVLIKNRQVAVAKAYILYRDLHNKIRSINSLVDSDELVMNYIQKLDWRVKENSNMAYSLQGLNNHVAGLISSNYWLNQIYSLEVREAHLSGDLHLHDLAILAAYCCGWDLQDFLRKGFRGVPGKINCKPPKHLRTALGQLINLIYTLQGETAGAQAVSNFDTLLAPFIYYDKLDYKGVKQCLQEFMFNINVPTRVGFQCPFSNITLDFVVPNMLAKEPIIIGGKPQGKTYGDFQKEVNILNKALGEVFLEGDAQGRVFSFPIPTINITKDFDWENPYLDNLWEATRKYGIPYFSNFINSDMKPEDVRSMCCRLRLSTTELCKKGGGLFGANPLTGCYDEETEVLTKDGWKFFKDLTKKDELFTLTENNEVQLHSPVKFFEYDYEGEMYKFFTKSLDLLVTPNHRMVVDQVQSGIRKFVQAQDFDFNNQRIPKKSFWLGEEQLWFLLPGIEYTKYGNEGKTSYQVLKDNLKIKMDDWLKFFGFWIAEGSTDNEKIAPSHGYRVIISQVNEQKREEIEKVLTSLPFNYTKESKNYVICNKQLWTHLRQFGKKYDKFIPQEIKKLSKRQLKILFDWMVKGDGHVRETTGQINYWTSSRILANDLQEIIMKLGFLGTLTCQQSKTTEIKGRKIKAGLIYVLGVQKAEHYRLRKNNIKKVSLKGKVYCCEVKNHTVFVRRNGKVSWCGNSVGVVTINLPRIGYLSKTKKEFKEQLVHLMDLAKESLVTKRRVVEDFTEKGLYPYSRYYLQSIKERFGEYWKNHFNTIGLVGMNEACLNFWGKDIASPEGKSFALEVLDFMRAKMGQYQEEENQLFNLEATPAEGTSYRFAREDKKRFKDIIFANDKAVKEGKAEPFYTNSTQLPVNYTSDIFEALQHQDDLQCKYTGGCVEGGNKVLTDKGLLNIEYIVENFEKLKPIEALSYNSMEGVSEWDEIIDAITIDVEKKNKIKIKGERALDIVTSDWHPFFVLEKVKASAVCPICQKKVGNIKSFVAHLRYNPDCRRQYSILPKYKVVEKRADVLRVGDYILQNSDNLYLDIQTELNNDLMWLIGFFIGDGCLSSFTDNRGGNSLRRYKVRFFSENKGALEKVERILSKYFQTKAKVIQNDKRSKVLRELATSKKEVSEFFFKYGFKEGKKVYDVSISQEVKENLNKKNIFSLLVGLMDSDGFISKRDGDFEYYTVSSRLADDILEICTRAGIMISKVEKSNKRKNETSGWRLRIPSYQVTEIKDELTEAVKSFRIIKHLSDRKKRHLPVVRVKEISKVDVVENKFYDLTTRKNHNYLAGKSSLVFIHNTVLHGFLGESLPDIKSLKNLVKKIAENFHLPYYTITPTFSICPKHGYVAGEHFYCPKCDEEIGEEKIRLEKEGVEVKIEG